jgi:hypothetical protein
MAERTYWDCEQGAWVPSPPATEVPQQRTALEEAEEADVRSG